MNDSLTTFLIVAKSVLAVLLGIVVVSVAAWAFPRHGPLIASHVLIGVVVVTVLLPLCALLAFVGPVLRKTRRDIHRPAPRQLPRQAIALTHRQRRRMKR